MKHIVLAVLALGVTPAFAYGPQVVGPVAGLVCNRLVATERQMLDPRGTGIFILDGPYPRAARLTSAPSVVFVKEPRHLVSGYAEVVTIKGIPGWIEADKIRPFERNVRCVPSRMSDGYIGAG